MNIGAGEGLQDVLKSNLGPSGTLKMYVLCQNSMSANERLTNSGWWMEQAEYETALS